MNTAETNEAGEVIEPNTSATNASGEQEDDKPVDTEKENAETQATLPPDVEVSLGVTEGEPGSNIDEDFSDIPATVAPTTPVTQPTEGSSQIGDDFDITELTYESYIGMSGEDQKKVIDMFGSADDFVRWYNAVEAKYKAEHPDIEIGGDGSVDAGDLAG